MRNYENKNFATTLCRSRVGVQPWHILCVKADCTVFIFYYTVFHSVIYNSVDFPLLGAYGCAAATTDRHGTCSSKTLSKNFSTCLSPPTSLFFRWCEFALFFHTVHFTILQYFRLLYSCAIALTL